VDELAQRFETHRPHLRAVAYRMLGSLAEADDAVQEAWLRLHRTEGVDNLGGWLTTVVGRIALDMLRSRTTRREEPLADRLPDPVVTDLGPEETVVLADSVSLALLVVLQTLSPAERLAFVLHDLFAVPFEEVARVVDRSPAAAKQLASRARRRVRGQAPEPDADPARQRAVVDAFLAAARDGDFDALVAVLHPDVVVRADDGSGTVEEVRGAENVAPRAFGASQQPGLVARAALVNGAPGWISLRDGKPFAVAAITVRDGRVARMDILADPERLARLDLAGLDAP
jgi:RNA polymerase sigma factor (sigma-70 family)